MGILNFLLYGYGGVGVGSDYYSIRGGRGVAREFGDEVGRGCDGVDVSGVGMDEWGIWVLMWQLL